MDVSGCCKERSSICLSDVNLVCIWNVQVCWQKRFQYTCGGCLQVSFARNNAVVTSTQLIYYYFRKYTSVLVWWCLEVGAEREARWPVHCLAAAVNEGGERDRATPVVQVNVLVDSRLDVPTALLLWVSKRLAYTFAAVWMSTDRWMNRCTYHLPKC